MTFSYRQRCNSEGAIDRALDIDAAQQVLTPGLLSGCLPGVTREAVLELAGAMGLQVREEALPPAALTTAAEAFLTNSLLGVAPLVGLEGRDIGDGRPGSITRELAQRYQELVARGG